LEVLILRDFKSFEPEVLILGGFKCLFLEVLILVEFKRLLMSEMQKIEKFLEVLILGELSDAECANGWIWADKIMGAAQAWGRKFRGADVMGRGCVRPMQELNTDGNCTSTYIYRLSFECLWISIRMMCRHRRCAGRFIIYDL
jgi:hypothetical protein